MKHLLSNIYWWVTGSSVLPCFDWKAMTSSLLVISQEVLKKAMCCEQLYTATFRQWQINKFNSIWLTISPFVFSFHECHSEAHIYIDIFNIWDTHWVLIEEHRESKQTHQYTRHIILVHTCILCSQTAHLQAQRIFLLLPPLKGFASEGQDMIRQDLIWCEKKYDCLLDNI